MGWVPPTEEGKTVLDREDPDPWLALFLDDSHPIDRRAKTALLKCNASYSRRFLLPVLRPVIFVFFVLVHMVRRVFFGWPSLPKTLHWLIWWGLKNFATPDTNYLILRHFNVSTELLAFLRDNVPVGSSMTLHPLKPKRLADLKDNLFLQHDLNIFNFVIELNAMLQESGKQLEPPDVVDFSSISTAGFDLEIPPSRPWRIIDIQTAIELYTPLYALFLPKNDFVRAVNSLQLDEVIAVYVAKILDTTYHLGFIKNGHPLVPLSTFQAGHRLMLHGLDAEALHGWLLHMKAAAER